MKFSILIVMVTCAMIIPVFVACVDEADETEETTEAQEVDTSADEAAVRQLISQYEAGLNKSSIDEVMAVFGSDAVVLGNNSDASSGTDAIKSFYTSLFDSGTYDIAIDVQDVSVSGDLAIAWSVNAGSYQATAAEEATAIDSKSLVVCRKDGDWFVYYYMFNSNAGN